MSSPFLSSSCDLASSLLSPVLEEEGSSPMVLLSSRMSSMMPTVSVTSHMSHLSSYPFLLVYKVIHSPLLFYSSSIFNFHLLSEQACGKGIFQFHHPNPQHPLLFFFFFCLILTFSARWSLFFESLVTIT